MICSWSLLATGETDGPWTEIMGSKGSFTLLYPFKC